MPMIKLLCSTLLFVSLFSFAEKVEANKLSKISLKINNSFIALKANPSNQELQKEYLGIFPNKFSIFLDVFHPKNFDQLYDGHEHIMLFNELILKFPNQSIEKLLSLASEACFDADAPNYFRSGLNKFIEMHPEIYKENLAKLDVKKVNNITKFLGASFHLHDKTSGFCPI